MSKYLSAVEFNQNYCFIRKDSFYLQPFFIKVKGCTFILAHELPKNFLKNQKKHFGIFVEGFGSNQKEIYERLSGHNYEGIKLHKSGFVLFLKTHNFFS